MSEPLGFEYKGSNGSEDTDVFEAVLPLPTDKTPLAKGRALRVRITLNREGLEPTQIQVILDVPGADRNYLIVDTTTTNLSVIENLLYPRVKSETVTRLVVK